VGPIALFDKSFLQSISTDEAVWFDHFFMAVVCPIFHVETMADLAKGPTKGRPAEAVVRDIANKFPEWGGSPCVFHTDLIIHDLLGHHVPLRHQIPRPGGRSVKSGVVFEQTPEEEAFRRWQKGEFQALEKLVAAVWRKALGELDLTVVAKEMRSLGFTPQACRTLQDTKNVADTLVNGSNNPYARLALAMQFFRIPQQVHASIAQAWQNAGKRTLPEFAAYAAHCLTVEIFFQAALGASLIGGQRPSNRTDIAYLFYLPFSMVFVSSDNLHRQTAPLFMRQDQAFVWGHDLKQALKSINDHFLQLPETEREKGIGSFAPVPPDGNLVAELWDRFFGTNYRKAPPVKVDKEKQAELVKKLRQFHEQPTISSGAGTIDDAETVSVSRMVHKRRGSWWQVPKDYKEPGEDG
jgi:hypothetical protein